MVKKKKKNPNVLTLILRTNQGFLLFLLLFNMLLEGFDSTSQEKEIKAIWIRKKIFSNWR